MFKQRSLLIKLILVALISGPPCYLPAEMSNDRMSQGNNVGLEVTTGSTPLCGTHQFPRGSGNLIPTFEGGWGYTVAIVRDLDGDGVADDTTKSSGAGREITGGLGSLESYDLLESLHNAGENMYQACNRLEINRVWSSLDADDMATWPIEFRAGRTSTGAPILYGAETIVTRNQDSFRDRTHDAKMPMGASLEYSFYFLNYAESNNIVYGHLFIRNMSEYVKWNPNPAFVKLGARTPDGQIWNGLSAVYSTNYIGLGPDALYMDTGWALQSAKELIVLFDRDGIEPTYTAGGNAFMIGHKMIRHPSWNGETMEFTNQHNTHWASEFGFEGPKEVLVLESGVAYRSILGYKCQDPEDLAQDLYGGQINPFTGKPAIGYPSLLPPDDPRYDQWLWGYGGRYCHSCYSELHNLAPRDSTSLDYVLMFVYPKNPPMIMPPLDISNIDNPVMQEQLSPVEDYAVVAKVVYEGGYVLPATPEPPQLAIIPGNRQVTITWGDVNLNTPDPYYNFLQQHPEIDPNSVYREYDFEGFRLYRSFVGPSDSHAALIDECSLTEGNLHFYYLDSWDKDEPLYRMSNGMKVWYALVPYDLNYDVGTGDVFSLPDPASGKVWNRPGAGLYTVIPRSDASNFSPATFGGATYIGPATVAETTIELAGDGTGKLTEAPKLLVPPFDFSFEAVNNERIAQDLTIYVACTGLEVDWGCSYWARPERVISLLDGSSNVLSTATPFLTRNATAEIILMDKPDGDGVNYAVHALWDHPGSAGSRDYAPVYIDFNTGGYTGATVANQYGSCVSSRVGTGPSIGSYIQTGVFELTWKSAGGDLTVEVTDKLRGSAVPFSPYREDKAWGFMPGGTYMDFFNEVKAGVSKAERANLMLEKIPAGNTDEFALSLNGIVWAFTDLTAMPASGTVMTVTNAFGTWNGDKTVFTQYADAPYPGEKWELKIKAMTMDPEDADLSKIRAVPNPYLATSFLDLSPNSRRIEFVNLPDRCSICIYSLAGNLVNVLNHVGNNRFGWGNYTDWDRLDQNSQPRQLTGYDNHGGTEAWNLRNRFGQTVASGLYFYHVTDSRGKTHIGRFYIIN
ncbi:MAG TPA: hypothetical protein VM123_10940 [archaeon]|nr:hypothetical protein [archaeon]